MERTAHPSWVAGWQSEIEFHYDWTCEKIFQKKSCGSFPSAVQFHQRCVQDQTLTFYSNLSLFSMLGNVKKNLSR